MKKKLLLLSAATLILGACTPTIAQRGNLVEDNQIEDVVLGVHTRTDVLRLLGSPTTTAPFDDLTWYYMGQETEKRGILDPKITKERVIIVKFNDRGVVQSIKDNENGRIDIPVARDKTPTHGNEISVLQEFLGNLGRFNPQASQTQ